MENIATNLRLYKAMYNLSTQQMLRRLGITKPTYYKWVNGEVNIGLKYQEIIATTLGVDLEDVALDYSNKLPFKFTGDTNAVAP